MSNPLEQTYKMTVIINIQMMQKRIPDKVIRAYTFRMLWAKDLQWLRGFQNGLIKKYNKAVA